tara:strand:- start:35 stop:457 length:423 start_codon:yes stop_codon:yes gene_type:complete
LKREQLKKALKPVIVECVREALYEEGVLSSIISEVVQGLGANVISESPPRRPAPVREAVEPAPPPRPKLNETRKQLLEAVSAGAYNGIDLFEGVTPAPAPSSPTAPGDPLSDADPTDPGIDISGIMSVGGKKWKALSGRN